MTEQRWWKVYCEAMERKRPTPEPSASIQWKGTDVCMDVRCECGARYHIDGEFCQFVKCPKCEKTFVCVPDIQLLEVPNDEDDPLPMTLTGEAW